MTNPPNSLSETKSNEMAAVFVVDDDTSTRDVLSAVFSPTTSVHWFRSAEEFLQQPPTEGPACLLVDQRLPGISGNELLRHLNKAQRHVPTVLLATNPDTPLTVDAMRNGAMTVLEKTCGNSAISEAVGRAIELDRQRTARDQRRKSAAANITKLNDNEREVLKMVLDGVPNKQIATRMGVCVRTIESRRSKIYSTTGVATVAELVRLCVVGQFIDA